MPITYTEDKNFIPQQVVDFLSVRWLKNILTV